MFVFSGNLKENHYPVLGSPGMYVPNQELLPLVMGPWANLVKVFLFLFVCLFVFFNKVLGSSRILIIITTTKLNKEANKQKLSNNLTN